MNHSNCLPTLEVDSRSPSSITLAPAIDWTAMSKSEHFVQFYEEDAFLTQSVAGFMGAGLQQGEAGIIIATEAHRAAIIAHLQEQGLDVSQAEAVGQFFVLDAAETLSRFMQADAPAAAQFNKVIGGLVAQATAGNRPLRAFGEMVALLWQRGNADGAIRLEELWNELGKEYSFSLFCAYPMGGFCADAHGKPFTHICKAHTRVIPAESYTANNNADDRMRTITLLQQRAASLEAEIAERKKVETVLARRERELSDFLENATEGIHQVAPTGTILWANKAELDLLGYAPEEYISQDIRKFHADAGVIADILDRLTRGETLHEYEARLKHKDGSIRHVSINSSMYREGEQLRYTRCFMRDITERKRAAEVLEETVADRTAKLRETLGELEAFSYSVSHDMRSPLRAMQGYARALLKDYSRLLPEGGIDSLKRIERAANRLDMLVRDILSYTKVAKDEIQLAPIGLESLLKDILEQHPELQESRDRISIERPLHSVLGHEAYLSQCLSNLLENGLKFVAPGTTPRVRIGSEAVNGHVRVWVNDNGVGIAPQHYDRIFKIFGRVYPEKSYPGTGIGLAVAKKAITRMGGKIGFNSEPGKGSTFWFTLRPATNQTNGH